jgi:hypothetical protein
MALEVEGKRNRHLKWTGVPNREIGVKTGLRQRCVRDEGNHP